MDLIVDAMVLGIGAYSTKRCKSENAFCGFRQFENAEHGTGKRSPSWEFTQPQKWNLADVHKIENRVSSELLLRSDSGHGKRISQLENKVL